MRTLLIGYGLFGKHHANAIAKAPGAELAAVAAASAESRHAAQADHPGVEVFADFREALARPDIEAVDIVAPNQLHYEMAKAALAAGKHLLLEKPMALTSAECDDLIALAERQGVVLAINHELRHSSLWGGVRDLIDAGRIGEPRYCLIELSRFPYRPGSGGWRYDAGRVGNWILEEPIHFFDLARWYFAAHGEPGSVFAAASSGDARDLEMQHNVTATARWAGGAYAVISQTLAAFGHHVSAKIAGTEGAIWAAWSAADARSDQTTSFLRVGSGFEYDEIPLAKPAGELHELDDQLAAFVRCVKEGETPACTARDGRWSVRLCEGAEESIRSGKEVAL
ncbi:MAG: Gfo/Idh/MocA family oxidoreductase [Verrucomicrobiales bacterium]